MTGTAEQFEQAAQELHALSSLFDACGASEDPLALTADWVKRLDQVLRAGGVRVADSSLPRPAQEVAHYRDELLRMKDKLEKHEQLLSFCCAKMRTEQTRVKRVHAWSNAVEFLR